MADSFGLGRRLLAPEVVQSSAMDCGPAALKCLLEGFGISASYGRLREACQTDVDGTSIDTLEEAALQLGLEAEQVIAPVDHLLLPGHEALPAIVVVRLPSGITHFAVPWLRIGPFVQIMDPATGRRWSTCRQFLDEVYVHEMPVPAQVWRDWAGSDGFLDPLRQRMGGLGLDGPETDHLVDAARQSLGWRPLAALDAATRMVSAIVRAGGLRRGHEAERALACFFEHASHDLPSEELTVPDAYWSARMAPPGPEGGEQVLLRGAVLVHVHGRRQVEAPPESAEGPAPLSPELVAALEEPPARPSRELLQLLRADGLLAPAVLAAAMAIAAAVVVIQALLFRGLLELGLQLGTNAQRRVALAALLAFLVAYYVLQLQIVAGLARLGRRLDARLRLAFLAKLPRLGDRYFQSRLISDMAERSHSIHQLRALPRLGFELLWTACTLVFTTLGIIWLDPASAPIAILSGGLAITVPLIAQPALAERDLRVRTHVGALSRFYLDALQGLVAVRTHGAERSMLREHESLLVEWARSSIGRFRAVVAVEGVQLLIGFGLAAWLLLSYLARQGESAGVLLLAYWALSLPVLGQEVALLARQYPVHRSVTLRLLEPLGAPEGQLEGREEEQKTDRSSPNVMPTTGAQVDLEGVNVRVAGHTVLEGIDLRIEPGSHVAIVGPSGAGKSTLVGLLLGWHRPATGRLRVDGALLHGWRLEQLRRATAWVDPAVQLWNRSLTENLRYGSPEDVTLPMDLVVDQADLQAVLERLPDGLRTPLGEGGALVSGGEGQRVRFGRALVRPGVRLVILDEPFRGLDREKRRRLLARARELWREATLLCITHDVAETRTFDRVVVMDEGRVVETGLPSDLAGHADSRYGAMLDAETAIRQGLWFGGGWRWLRLDDGRVVEGQRQIE